MKISLDINRRFFLFCESKCPRVLSVEVPFVRVTVEIVAPTNLVFQVLDTDVRYVERSQCLLSVITQNKKNHLFPKKNGRE